MNTGKKVEVFSVEKTGARVKTSYDIANRGVIIAGIEAYKAKNWKSETVFYMSGAIHVKLTGKNYGVKSTIESIVIPDGVKEPQLKYDLARLLTQTAIK